MEFFDRKILEEMENWKRDLSRDFALLIEGARRVGKTTVVERFIREHYASSILIDFSKPPKGILELFEEGASDLNYFFLHLQRIMKTELVEHESVIVFDEVQLCSAARQMIKHLVKDGRYEYIETGSLISLRQNIQGILIPSEEHRIQMYPMDFEEFLWSMNDRLSMEIVRDSFGKRIPLGREAHISLMRTFKTYMLIGGMPAAVSAFLNRNSFEAVETIKKSILTLYYEDLGKIKGDPTGKCKRIFSSIPGLLSKHDKSFKANTVKRNSRLEEYLDAVNSLAETKTVNICRRCTDPGPALDLFEDEEGFKIYMGDTGLLFTSAFDSNLGDKDEIYDLVLRDRIGINEGMFFENVVAQELRSSGHELFFSRFRTEDTVNTQEVDFILSKRGKVIPVEVKSSSSKRHVSLDRFREKYRKRIGESFVICTKDLCKGDDGITYVPAYMASLLGSD